MSRSPRRIVQFVNWITVWPSAAVASGARADATPTCDVLLRRRRLYDIERHRGPAGSTPASCAPPPAPTPTPSPNEWSFPPPPPLSPLSELNAVGTSRCRDVAPRQRSILADFSARASAFVCWCMSGVAPINSRGSLADAGSERCPDIPPTNAVREAQSAYKLICPAPSDCFLHRYSTTQAPLSARTGTYVIVRWHVFAIPVPKTHKFTTFSKTMATWSRDCWSCPRGGSSSWWWRRLRADGGSGVRPVVCAPLSCSHVACAYSVGRPAARVRRLTARRRPAAAAAAAARCRLPAALAVRAVHGTPATARDAPPKATPAMMAAQKKVIQDVADKFKDITAEVRAGGGTHALAPARALVLLLRIVLHVRAGGGIKFRAVCAPSDLRGGREREAHPVREVEGARRADSQLDDVRGIGDVRLV
jgi:hypothetical protein